MSRIGSAVLTGAVLVLMIMSLARSLAPVATARTDAVGGPAAVALTASLVRTPAGTGASQAPIPAVSSVQVRSTWGWLGRTVGASVPLTSADCSAAILPPGTVVGYVQAPSGLRAQVLARCAGLGRSDQIALTFSGLAHTGATYSGTIAVGGAKVALTVQRASSAFLPLVALAFGVVIALFLLKRGPARVIAGLRSRLSLAVAAIGDEGQPGQAVLAFRRAAGPQPWNDLDLFDSVRDQSGQISTDITELSRANRFSLKATDPAVVALSRRITVLEQISPELGALGTALSALSAGLPVVQASHLVPLWAQSAAGYLRPAGPMVIADFAAVVASAKEAAEVAAWFPSVAQQVRSAQERLAQLGQPGQAQQPGQPEQAAQVPPAWPAAEQQQIDSAQGSLDVALAAFARAESSSDVRAAYAGEFTVARQAVDALGSLQVLAVSGAVAEVLRPASLLSVSLPTPEQIEQVAELVVRRERTASVLALIIVAALLLFAGLRALVIGKTFGTPWDFAAAVAWGSVTSAVTAPLATAIEGYQRIRTTPE
jgi:hypothetical protein